MDAALYERFVSLKDEGKKAEAKATLALFIASFETPEERRGWVLTFLGRGDYGHRIRSEIYKNLVYPALLDGYLKEDASSAAWLAKTAGNLCQIKPLHPALENKGDFALFKEAYALAPEEETRAGLLNTLLKGFDYSQHEWPVGILYGSDGATIEQCEEILQEVKLARQLDREREHATFFADFEAMVIEFMARVQEG